MLRTASLMERLLGGLGETRAATNGVDALRLARESTPNLVLCLSRVCQRPSDMVTRCSESSFALLLPGTPRFGAEHIAYQVLDAVEALHMPHGASSVSNHVTISAGIGCHDSHSANWIVPSQESHFANAPRDHRRADDLMQAAEASLLAAQLGGGAQAWLPDMADGGTPRLAREISPKVRAAGRS